MKTSKKTSRKRAATQPDAAPQAARPRRDWKRLALKIAIATFFLFGLLQLFLAWRQKIWFQASALLLSLLCFGIAELVSSTEHVEAALRQKVSKIANTLFLGVLFLALAFLAQRYLTADWGQQLELALLMLGAVYYSLTFMQLAFLRS